MSQALCDPNVYKTVFLQHSRSVRNFMLYKLGDLQLAEDLTQEAFLRLWNNCSAVEVEKAKSYVFSVANNLMLDHIKHQKVVRKYIERNPVREKQTEDPAFLLQEKEFAKQLETAIGKLSEKQRVVFLMNRIEKLKYREIAERLDISVKAVEKRMHKALIELRKLTKKI